MATFSDWSTPEITTKAENWEIQGGGGKNPILSIALDPNAGCQGEAGAMIYYQNGIKMKTKSGGFFGGLKSAMGGEDPFKLNFNNESEETQYIGLTPNQPLSSIIPVNLGEMSGNRVYAKRGAWFASSDQSITSSFAYNRGKSCLACCCGGMAPIIQIVEGESTAFLASMGTVITATIPPGKTIKVDSTAVLAMEENVEFDVKQVGSCGPQGCCAFCFGGEGCFLTTLTASNDEGARVWLSTYDMDKLTDLLVTVHEEGEGGDGGGGAPADPKNMER